MSPKKQKRQPRPAAEKPDGQEALQRTADLVRRIVNVPKSEVATDTRKERERPSHA